MKVSRSSQQIYTLLLFKNGLCAPPKFSKLGRGLNLTRAKFEGRREFSSGRFHQISARPVEGLQDVVPKSPKQIEAIVLHARRTFGETLPKDFLSLEEYKIYERLYGPPTRESRPEDIRLLQWLGKDGGDGEDLLLNEKEKNPVESEYLEGEPVENKFYEVEEDSDVGKEESEVGLEVYEESEETEGTTPDDKHIPMDGDAEEFKARMTLYMDMVAAGHLAEPVEGEVEEVGMMEEDEEVNQASAEGEAEEELDKNRYEEDDLGDSNSAYENSDSIRTHPLTAAGRFGTSPATLQLPKDTVVDPITALLADASNKHLTEVAQKTFGGPRLPNSAATPGGGGHLKQQPIALEASHFRMGEMEANTYLAAITPGTYAAVMSSLVEIRKRTGSEWIKSLLAKDGGPRILDAGGAGAGVLAWRDLLQAEWELLHDGVPDITATPVGKSTVVVGSAPLRLRMSRILENTTFLPRLPDYNPSLDHASLEDKNPTPRKQYDIIIAPHTLWPLKEDYIRKSQVQNFWSLLNPDGGVLLIVEKGVPRGFELVAGARETLLKHHISSPDSETVENAIDEPFQARTREKEAGMIIAPCTNHLKCPMYLIAGQSTGRKDYCHFSQRYIRPHFLQRILGAKDRNHEDIRFSYVAVQRGIDQRQTLGILQGKTATDAAFIGYESGARSEDEGSSDERSEVVSPAALSSSSFHTLSLPRAILPPIKRHKHIIVDLCTPMGQIERWTVPKSFSKQAFRDARKSQWGDLWALGAKTRILRNVRLGINKNKKARGKSVFEAGKDDDEERLTGANAKFEKRTKMGRTPSLRKRDSADVDL